MAWCNQFNCLHSILLCIFILFLFYRFPYFSSTVNFCNMLSRRLILFFFLSYNNRHHRWYYKLQIHLSSSVWLPSYSVRRNHNKQWSFSHPSVHNTLLRFHRDSWSHFLNAFFVPFFLSDIHQNIMLFIFWKLDPFF
mgnify:CR=1 FL=1